MVFVLFHFSNYIVLIIYCHFTIMKKVSFVKMCLLLTERVDEGIIVNSYEDLVRKHVVRFESCHEITCFCICKNKGADQLHGSHASDQRLCFRYMDSTIPLNPKFQASSHLWFYSPV